MYLYTALEKPTRLLNQTLLAYIRSYTELFTFFPVFFNSKRLELKSSLIRDISELFAVSAKITDCSVSS